ncbi:MAG: tRNA (guanosine(46)-N7)-methyltransferase TrmB [Candidatus Thiodiazotropha endolucinida]
MSVEQSHRPIRSYVLRQGRLTEGQQRAFQALWPQYGLTLDQQPLRFASLFGREAPVTLEIGFGNGEALAQIAARHPEQDFLGVEVHTPGVGHLMLKLAEQASDNVRIVQADAMELLRHHMPEAALDRVQLYFPDPWHKRRHHKRRIVQQAFADLIHQALKPGGVIHMATDWEEYARQMLDVFTQHDGFRNQAGKGNFSPRPDTRPLTKFEQRGQQLGHGVWDLLFEHDS